jgi:hypothetical protein
MTSQVDMFAAAPAGGDANLVGLAITLPEHCLRCRGHDAVIGIARGPHKASIMCVCGRHLGWMSVPTFNFIAETVRQFGRPSDPICVTRKPPTSDSGTEVATTTAIAPKGKSYGKYF